MTVPNSRRGSRGGAHSFSQGTSASPSKGPGRAGQWAPGPAWPRSPSFGHTSFALNKRKKEVTGSASALSAAPHPLGRGSPAHSRGLLGNVVFETKPKSLDWRTSAQGMRRGAHEAKREVAVPVNNRNPKNRKFWVAGKFNTQWGKGPRSHAHSRVLTRKWLLFTEKTIFPDVPQERAPGQFPKGQS